MRSPLSGDEGEKLTGDIDLSYDGGVFRSREEALHSAPKKEILSVGRNKSSSDGGGAKTASISKGIAKKGKDTGTEGWNSLGSPHLAHEVRVKGLGFRVRG